MTLTELIAVNCCVSRAWTTWARVRTNGFQKLVEQRPGVMRPGRGLRVVLHSKDRFGAVAKPFYRSVVHVDVRDLELRGSRNVFILGRVGSRYREAMVLRRDQHAPRRQLFHRVISASVAVRHLHRLRTLGERQDLMSQADAEDRHAAVGD